MTTDAREKTLVVIQLTGGNDFMNTLVPRITVTGVPEPVPVVRMQIGMERLHGSGA